MSQTARDPETSPELEPRLLVVRGSRRAPLLHREGLAPSGWQLTLTTAGMVAVVNSVVVAAITTVARATPTQGVDRAAIFVPSSPQADTA